MSVGSLLFVEPCTEISALDHVHLSPTWVEEVTSVTGSASLSSGNDTGRQRVLQSSRKSVQEAGGLRDIVMYGGEIWRLKDPASRWLLRSLLYLRNHSLAPRANSAAEQARYRYQQFASCSVSVLNFSPILLHLQEFPPLSSHATVHRISLLDDKSTV